MGSGPLALPLFYQYKCTCERMDRLCRNGSWQIRDIHACRASINIKRGNMIMLDLLGLPAAQSREVLDRLPAPQPITPGLKPRRHRSRGQAALLSIPLPTGRRRAAAAV
jgi:hypothetical protein